MSKPLYNDTKLSLGIIASIIEFEIGRLTYQYNRTDDPAVLAIIETSSNLMLHIKAEIDVLRSR
jgi:hypothetical protein